MEKWTKDIATLPFQTSVLIGEKGEQFDGFEFLK